MLSATGESRVAERLVQRTDRMRGVLQFFIHCNDNTAETDDDSDNADRQDENKFSGDDQTGFVIPKFLHVRGLFD